jgi:hypothetical protein
LDKPNGRTDVGKEGGGRNGEGDEREVKGREGIEIDDDALMMMILR